VGEQERVHDPVLLSVAAYSNHAGEYSAAYAGKFADRVERFSAVLAKQSLILDAGCGPGRDLARFISQGHAVRGVDLNPVFVEMANQIAPTVLGDLREVDSLFPSENFGGIWAMSSLVHLSEDETADVLGQFFGLLHPGGRLYACVNAVGETGWLDELDGRRWYTIWEPELFAEAVARAGFVVDEVVRGVVAEVWATRS
jgi:SAM-dependent methyltransferase